MAALCDVYVNDAFGTAHRAEATTHGIARFAKVACAGPLLAAELDALGKALRAAEASRWWRSSPDPRSRPSSPSSNRLAAKVDQLIVGGGIANTFMLAAGLPIGKSLAEPGLVDEAQGDHRRGCASAARQCRSPSTSSVPSSSPPHAEATVKAAADVAADDLILDIGPKTATQLAAILCQGRDHRLERPGRRIRVRRLRRGHGSDRPRDRRIERHSPSPAAATRWPRSPSSASPTRSTTSRPAAAPSSSFSRVRRCRRWPRSRTGPDEAGNCPGVDFRIMIEAFNRGAAARSRGAAGLIMGADDIDRLSSSTGTAP